jgi:hypothetical protein
METIKKIFLYLCTLTGLTLTIIGSVMLLNLALKQWIFTKADYNYCPPEVISQISKDRGWTCEDQRTADKQSEAAQALALIITGTPVMIFFYRRTHDRKQYGKRNRN